MEKEMEKGKRMNEKKRDCAVLGIMTIALCLVLCGGQKVFGSKVDWISQHSVIADYFRQQFYETGQLFPEFAANLGGGQNIYHFSYYGLYSPIILFSYLLPFVRMGDYLMAASAAGLAVSVILFYCWLRARGFSRAVSFGTASMFLLAGPMIFHSYSQIMFVNYMPFLCMGFWGVDRYFESGRKTLFTFSVFLMIMTSFYFSICGMLVLVLYGLHRYFQVAYERGNKVTVPGTLGTGAGFGMRMLTAVMMSGILLVPTALALTGRNGIKEDTRLWELLIPDVSVMRWIYDPYGVGLTTFVFTVLIAGLAYRRAYERVLTYGTVIVLSVPVFAWMLNGGLYVRDKVLIPFLPLLCYLAAYYLEKMSKRKGSFWGGLLPYLLTLGVLYLEQDQTGNSNYWKLAMLDGILMTVCFVIFRHKKSAFVLLVPPVAFLLVFAGFFHNHADRMLDRNFYNRVTDEEIGEAVSAVLEKENGLYRMEQMGTVSENGANLNRIWNMEQYVSSIYSSSYNENYQEFRQTVFEVEEPFRNFLMQSVSWNPLFQRFMGVKYLILYEEQNRGSAVKDELAGAASDSVIPGYELYDSVGGTRVYCNENVSPIAYGTDRVMSEEEYRTLKFPYNQLALMSYAVIKNENTEKREMENTGIENIEIEKELQEAWKVTPAELEIGEQEKNGNPIQKSEDGYHVQVNKKQTVNVHITEAAEEHSTVQADAKGNMQVLFLQFQVKNNKPSKDVSIWVEKEKNTLSARSHIYYNENTTFTYAVSIEEGQKDVGVTFGTGDYEITDVKCYLSHADQETIQKESKKLYQEEFQNNKEKTQGNQFAGTIQMKTNGFFITSIPYDAGFEVMVDGQKADYEEVNTAFLGFKVPRGSHQVEIIYHAPGTAAGKGVSAVGTMIFAGFFLADRKRAKAQYPS